MIYSMHQSIKRNLAGDIPPVAPLAIDVMRVPLAEDIIWSAVRRMAMIVGARIDGQLVKQFRIKVSLMEQQRIGRSEDGHRFVYEVMIPAPCRSRAADKQRYWPETLVVIGFALRTGFQNRD